MENQNSISFIESYTGTFRRTWIAFGMMTRIRAGRRGIFFYFVRRFVPFKGHDLPDHLPPIVFFYFFLPPFNMISITSLKQRSPPPPHPPSHQHIVSSWIDIYFLSSFQLGNLEKGIWDLGRDVTVLAFKMPRLYLKHVQLPSRLEKEVIFLDVNTDKYKVKGTNPFSVEVKKEWNFYLLS